MEGGRKRERGVREMEGGSERETGEEGLCDLGGNCSVLPQKYMIRTITTNCYPLQLGSVPT